LYRRRVKRVGAILVAVLAIFFVAGCGSGSNTQSQPIGSRCKSNGNCGTSPFTCELTGYPGGYCDKPCATDGDCPLDSLCLPNRGCRRRCNDSTELCRTDEADGNGYGCVTSPATTGSFCDVLTLVDGGVDGG
jgi:hypothetical protein